MFNSQKKDTSSEKNMAQVAAVKLLSNKLQQELNPQEPEIIDDSTIIPNIPLKQTITVQSIKISIEQEDCLVVAKRLIDLKQSDNILIMDLANRIVIGGGWEKGCNGQEESIFYRTNYFQSLYSKASPESATDLLQIRRRYYKPAMTHNTVYYSKNVTLLYECDQNNNYQELPASERIKLNILAVAGYDLGKSRDPTSKRFSLDLSKLDPKDSRESELLEEYNKCKLTIGNQQHDQFSKLAALFTKFTRDKLLLTFKAAFINDNDVLILGAISCGAFKFTSDLLEEPKKGSWTVDCVVQAYEDAFNEAQPQGWLDKVKSVVFAIKVNSSSDQEIYNKFAFLQQRLANKFGINHQMSKLTLQA